MLLWAEKESESAGGLNDNTKRNSNLSHEHRTEARAAVESIAGMVKEVRKKWFPNPPKRAVNTCCAGGVPLHGLIILFLAIGFNPLQSAAAMYATSYSRTYAVLAIRAHSHHIQQNTLQLHRQY